LQTGSRPTSECFLSSELSKARQQTSRVIQALLETEVLQAVREKFQTITDRFAGFQAQWLNVHVDFPLLQRIALPITVGSSTVLGIAKLPGRNVAPVAEIPALQGRGRR
jgi:hypothetical protein